MTNDGRPVRIAMFRPLGRVPCKLNNVTKRKHQTEQLLKLYQRSPEYAVKSITRKGRRKTNEVMINDSMKDLKS